MKDIEITQRCHECGYHLWLRSSIRVDDSEFDGSCWLVKYCPHCGGYPVEEIIRLYDLSKEK